VPYEFDFIAVVAVLVGAGVSIEAGETFVYGIVLVVEVNVVLIVVVGAEIVSSGYGPSVYVPYELEVFVVLAVIVAAELPAVTGETFVGEDLSIVVIAGVLVI
jgi:hypothetical protein